MNRRFAIPKFAITLAVALTGCATTYPPASPPNTSAPRAQLDDSTTTHGTSKADFFVVEEIDGAKVNNSLNETLRRNQGKGMAMTPSIVSRPVIADKPLKLLIKGRTHFAAPILALAGTVYQVRGTVEFTPKADGKYVVRGKLGDEYSVVWIEDAATAEPVGNKVEVKGSAKLGLLEK